MKNTRVVASTGGWFDPTSNRIGLALPSDMFVGFGEVRHFPLTTASFNGVNYCFGVMSTGGNIVYAGHVALNNLDHLMSGNPQSTRGHHEYVVPFHVRTNDIESDAALLRCVGEIEKVVAITRATHPSFRGIVNIYPCSMPGFEMYGLTAEHYASSRLNTLCRTLANLGVVVGFLPRYPADYLNQREAEKLFVHEVVAPLMNNIPTLRILLHQVCTVYGIEWVTSNAYENSSDGKPRIIASLSPFDMEEPYDVQDPDLSDYQKKLCHDAAVVRYNAFSRSDCFCLGSGSNLASDAFRVPVLMPKLLERAFDVHRLPRLSSHSSSVSDRDQQTCRDLCASRIDEVHRFTSVTGLEFLGLPQSNNDVRVVFELRDNRVPMVYQVNPRLGSAPTNVIIPWCANEVLAWSTVLDSVES